MSEPDASIRRDLDRRRDQLIDIHDPRTAIAFEGMQSAILGVLDRHKENPVNGSPSYCDKCEGGYEGRAVWPCPTIVDVANALGVGVGND